jgi:ABC-type uncharacterized transport system permease subunit
VSEFVAAILLAGIPLLFAAFGGVVAERAGVLNVGLEGLMLWGAFLAAWISASAGDVAGVLAAVVATAVLGALLGWIKVSLRADQVVAGIAFNIVALGATSYAFPLITHGDIARMSSEGGGLVRVPGLAELPWIGTFFDQHWLAYAGYVTVPVLSLILFRTGLGIRLRACGEFAEGARASGVDVIRTRIGAMAASGMLAGVGGAYLVVAGIHQFGENMTSGQGYIALAVIILGRWTPLGAAAAALLFALATAVTFRLQADGVSAPPELFFAMPYVITLLAVAIAGRRVRPPAEDGRPLYLTR